MAHFRLQFSLKWLVAFALLCGTLVGIWGSHIKTRRERERAELDKYMQQFRAWDGFWELEPPDRLTPPRTEDGIIGP